VDDPTQANDAIIDDYIEVEQKFKLNDLKIALEKIIGLGGVLRSTGEQRDIYFDGSERSFLADPISSEWLRLRFQDEQVSLNYKLWHPLRSPAKTHCDEFETFVSDGEAMLRTLNALGYRELVVVAKRREEWELGNVLIAIDEVDGLGNFIELEYVGEGISVAEAHSQLTATVEALGLDLGPSHEGYPHQLLALSS